MNECMMAVQNKDRHDALAFALLVKITFADSIIKSTSIRKLTKIFRMGWKRLSRVLNNALHYGYIVKEGETYFVQPLKQRGSFNKKLVFTKGTLSLSKDGRTEYRFNEIKKIIRKETLKNHIRKQSDFLDTASVVNAPVDDKEYRRNKARLKRMSGLTSVSDDLLKDSARLSINRIMKVTGTKRSTAKKLVKEMVAKGEIIRSFENIPVDMDYKELEKDYVFQQAVYKANKLGGWLHIFKSAVYIQTANRYSLTESEHESFTYSPRLK